MGKKITILGAFVCILAVVLNTETALLGARKGIELCLQQVIPALFPLSVLSAYLCANIEKKGKKSILSSLLRIPPGCQHLFLMSFFSGYPAGIQNIVQSNKSGLLSEDCAKRMTAFCANPGISFLFGMGVSLFPSLLFSVLSLICIVLSSLLTGILYPGGSVQEGLESKSSGMTIVECVMLGVRNMAKICGFIVLFQVILAYIPVKSAFLIGLFELTSGVLALHSVALPLRFVLFCALLSFGGLCVSMQSQTIARHAGLPFSEYLPGKTLQGLFSLLLSGIIQLFFSWGSVSLALWTTGISLLGLGVFVFFLKKRKIRVEIPEEIMYNTKKKGGYVHDFSEENKQAMRLLPKMRKTG